MSRGRALVVGFSLEANSFVPGETTLDDFRAQTFAVGDEIDRDLLGSASELSGALDVLAAAGVEAVPAVVATSAPGAPIAPEALAEIVRLAVARCDDSLDGAYVMLHGSAVCRTDDDPEGTLLSALRARLGSGVPIAVSLDHHAHLTERMAGAVDAITAYRTCPHVDLRERGAQAARILADAISGRIRPVCAVARRPMITPADRHRSDEDPFRRLMALCDAAEADGALAAALLPVQPWIDVPELGWKCAVTYDGDGAAAARAAEAIMDEAWNERFAFLDGERLPVDEALAEALRLESPVVVADAGDATNGGSLGDSTELLRAALRRGNGARVLLSVCDAAAADAAVRAAPGAVVSLALGGGGGGAYNERVEVSGRVVAVGDGELHYTHPAAAGTRDTAGASALVEAGSISIVVHSKPVRVIDPVLYEALGADPSEAQVIQAKSHVSYRAGFERVTARSIVADTPGPTAARLESLPYRRRPRPLFPFEEASPRAAVERS